ncbi:hypothetical protein BRDID11002_84560 [Bradyrhizobium diazoefficiens]
MRAVRIRHCSSEEAIRSKRGEIDLNAFGAAIGFDEDRSGKETSRETRLSVGNIRLAPKRNAEGCPQIHEKRQRKRRRVPEAGQPDAALAIERDAGDQPRKAWRGGPTDDIGVCGSSVHRAQHSAAAVPLQVDGAPRPCPCGG